MNLIDTRTRIGIGLLALSLLSTAALVTPTPRAYAAPADPASCNALVQKYFKSSKPTGSTVAFNLVSDGITRIARYIEGSLTLAKPAQLFSPTSMAGSGKQYTSSERHDFESFDTQGDPFNPDTTESVNVSVSYSVLAANDRQLFVKVAGADVTPAGCVGDSVLYGTLIGSWGYAEAVIISLGLLTDPVAPPA